MLYRYCSFIFIFPNQNEWAIYKLRANNTPGTTALQHNSAITVDPGNYIVLDLSMSDTLSRITGVSRVDNRIDQAPITINLTTNCAPRRVRTPSTDSHQSQGQSERSCLVKSM